MDAADKSKGSNRSWIAAAENIKKIENAGIAQKDIGFYHSSKAKSKPSDTGLIRVGKAPEYS